MTPTSGTHTNGLAVGAADALAHPLLARLARLPHSQFTGFAASAFESGLSVRQAVGSDRAIPIAATPLIIDDAVLHERARTASLLLAATARCARWRLREDQRADVLAALGKIEGQLVMASWDAQQAIAVGRVDFFGDTAARALEVNATIPAMQAYSDIAAESWLRMLIGDARQLSSALAANGSNTNALLDSLVHIYRSQRRDELTSIALLCRPDDAQISELQFLRQRFRDAGLSAEIVHPDMLTWRRGLLHCHNMPFQLVYRHLFLGRLDSAPSSALVEAMAPRNHGSLVLNRPAAHLELKSTLALLSLASTQDGLAEMLGFDAPELQAVRTSVPWTRMLTASTLQPLQETEAALARVIDDPDGHVLKRVWSYGGQAVFPGRARSSAAFATRAEALFPGVRGWRNLVLAMAADTRAGGFVAQQAIAPDERSLLVASADGVSVQRMAVDYSAFASLGATPAWGGVSRASRSDIVNIAAGGALVPVIRRSVADSLLAAGDHGAPATPAHSTAP